MKQRILNILALAFIAMIFGLAALLAFTAGCAPQLTPQTKATIDAGHQQAAIAAAKATDAGAVQTAKAKAAATVAEQAPIDHPKAATNRTIARLWTPLFLATLALGALWAVSIAARLSGVVLLAWAAPFEPALRWLAIIAFVLLLSLPILPWGFGFVGAAVLALFAYEVVKDKGNIRQAIADTETDIGIVRAKTTVEVTADPAKA